MSRALVKRNFLVRSLLVFGFWSLIGLSFAGQFFIASSELGRPISWQTALQHSLADWYVIAILSLLPLTLSTRFGLDGPQWWPRFVLHLAASGCFSLLFVLLRSAVGIWQEGAAPGAENFLPTAQTLLVKTWHFNILIYWVILSVGHALAFYRGIQEKETRTAELERRLAEARLQALQLQLNPHFLFNTLHAISALMHQDVTAADRMITRLSELLRRALESSDQHEVLLCDEMDFLQRYLEIEQTRFGDRLRIELDIADDAAKQYLPNLILQPLVENAIQHGIEPHAKPGRVRISARCLDSHLILQVSDSGMGTSKSIVDGVGLRNTRARLKQLYGQHHSFTVGKSDDGGLLVEIRIPRNATATYGNAVEPSSTIPQNSMT